MRTRGMRMLGISLLLALLVASSCCLGQPAASTARGSARYELKFQTELDNSTIIKRQFQQQIFKCQVKLAQCANQTKTRPKSKSTLGPLKQQSDSSDSADFKWPINATLSIDWFKDEQKLVLSSKDEQVVVINVELKQNNASSSLRKTKPRIEIKNTLNNNQLKLTSRLKLSQLKVSDSGSFKCVASVRFKLNEQNDSQKLTSSEQTLESNRTILMVTKDSPGELGENGPKDEIESGKAEPPSNDTQHANWQRQSLANKTPEANKGFRRLEMDNKDNGTSNEGARSSGQESIWQVNSQFEDDEDLFKMDPDRIEFISNAANEESEPKGDSSSDITQFDYQRQQQHESADNDSSSSSLSALSARDNQHSRNHDKNILSANPRTKLVFGETNEGKKRVLISDASLSPSFGVLAVGSYFGNSLDSTRIQLAKLVHKIGSRRMMPELSCYTNNGEHYRGNVSTSSDERSCLSWLHLKMALGLHNNTISSAAAPFELDNHNHCRNPNSDPLGPWCYVHYSEQLDGLWLKAQDLVVAKSEAGGTGSRSERYVRRHCSVSACSDYLWFYIVAPPLGFLLLLSCLVATLIRRVRKNRYNSMLFAEETSKSRTSGKKALPAKFNKLLQNVARGRLVSGKIGACSRKKKKCCGSSYLDEDIFEIVDELDWSDGQTQSLSPKSTTTESLKLNSSFSNSSSSNNMDSDSRLLCKPINLLSTGKLVDATTTLTKSDLMSSRSISGPTFATLRCHVRGTLKTNRKQQQQQASLIHQCDLATNCCTTDTCLASDEASLSNSPEVATASSTAFMHSDRRTTGNHSIASSSHLIPSEESSCGEKFIKCNELPQVSASSVSIALDQQPIYEGKFSHVRLANLNAIESESRSESSPLAQVGAQVAVFSLKANASIDQSVFDPSVLKLRNLNHLNLLKLIGYAQTDDDGEIGAGAIKVCQSKKPCSLIYDMSQLVDLNQWLKQQNADTMTSDEPGDDLGIRRNLTCFAKQIALAIDYLHDRGIIFKDLACRNCFLAPTKMLVKLASFNIELALSTSDSNAQNLKSMIRPIYLLDYYVIDSRPSDCQLLPLSWIPLESILFNKFNKQTDIWSFGCLIYELFSLGEVAYFGYSSKQVIDSVRSNLMPPQPLLCPIGVYKLMCKCLSDIPTIRPDIKQIYEQLNLYSGQCSSFLDHHLCSLATNMYDDEQTGSAQLNELKASKPLQSIKGGGSITKTKSYANIGSFSPSCRAQDSITAHNNQSRAGSNLLGFRPEVMKIPSSRSINLGGNRLTSLGDHDSSKGVEDVNHYDEPVIEIVNN